MSGNDSRRSSHSQDLLYCLSSKYLRSSRQRSYPAAWRQPAEFWLEKREPHEVVSSHLFSYCKHCTPFVSVVFLHVFVWSFLSTMVPSANASPFVFRYYCLHCLFQASLVLCPYKYAASVCSCKMQSCKQDAHPTLQLCADNLNSLLNYLLL